jgi:GNAT superfamily N-acetyltransferase
MTIRIPTLNELESCFKLELHYSSDSPTAAQDGFFLPQTDFSLYEGLYKDGYIRVTDDMSGFIMAVPPGHAVIKRLLANADSMILFDDIKLDPDHTAWVAKIATRQESRRKGCAKALYDQMFQDFAGNIIMTATALSPLRNKASEDFHRSLEMKACGVFLGGKKGNLENVVNTVWIRQF